MDNAWARAVLPVLLIVAMTATFFIWRPLDYLSEGTPPRERIVFEQVRLDADGIHAHVRAEGSVPMTVAQVQVDEAYWAFTVTPAGPLRRLQTARIDIPYPWIAGEAHAVRIVTNTGATFEHEIEVASAAAGRRTGGAGGLVMVGLFVGPLPVLIGLMFHPALRRAGRRSIDFLLGLTVGLLGFLLVDTIEEGLEAAGRAAPGLGGPALFWGAAAAALLVLLAAGRRGGERPVAAALAGFIALGIGLHNLGEGLAIGAAMSTGEVALASFLVLGFALHNVTEGIGIAAPMSGERPGLALYAGLVALAGLPAVAGTLAGAYAYAPHWAAVCFGLGAGAIAQVIFEVSALLSRRAGAADGLFRPVNAAGIVAGLAVMYATSLLITA